MERLLSIIVQWLHVVAAVLAVGGVACIRFVVLPSVEQLDDAARATFMESVHDKFRKIVGLSMGLLLITGLYNIGVAASAGYLTTPAYLYPIIVKIVLALVIFKIAFMLMIPGPAFSGVKAKRKMWLYVNFILGLIVILIAAYLRRLV
jgi:uncharacterized membrane protein